MDFFKSKEMDVKIDVRTVAAYKFAIMLLGCAHWIGCLYYETTYIGTVANSFEYTWLKRFKKEAGVFFAEDGLATWDKYLVSLQFSSYHCMPP